MAIYTHITPDSARHKWQQFYENLDADKKLDQVWINAIKSKKDKHLVALLVKAIKSENIGSVIILLEEAANRCIGLHDFSNSFDYIGKNSLADLLLKNDFLLYDLINDYKTLPHYQDDCLARHAWHMRDAGLTEVLIERGIKIDCLSDDDLVELVAKKATDMLAVLIKGQQLNKAKLKRIKAIAIKFENLKMVAITREAIENLESPPKDTPLITTFPDNGNEWHVISPECIARILNMPDNITRQQIFDFAAGRVQTLTYTKHQDAPTGLAEREEEMDWKGSATLLQMAFNALKERNGTPIKSSGPAPIEKKRPRVLPTAAKNS